MFYRDKDQKEIDLLIVQDQILYPIEIKKTGSPSKELTRNFTVLEKLNKKIGPSAVICFVDSVLPITKNNNAIPVSLI